MKILVLVVTLSVAGFAIQQHAPLYGDGRVTIFLLDIPPGQATLVHRHDRAVSVSGYTFSEDIPGTAAAVHTKKSGEIEPMAAGPARRWTNARDPAHLVVVTVR